MIIDANIVILAIDNDPSVTDVLTTWRYSGKTLMLPTIVEAEILSYSKLTSKEIEKIKTFIEENFTFIPLNRTIAQIAGEIRRATKIKLPDAIIAATALYTRVPIVTRNIRDFQRISNLEVIDIK